VLDATSSVKVSAYEAGAEGMRPGAKKRSILAIMRMLTT
jgi:hypothetical protein